MGMHTERYQIEAVWFDSPGQIEKLAALPADEQEAIKRRVLEIETGRKNHDIGVLCAAYGVSSGIGCLPLRLEAA